MKQITKKDGTTTEVKEDLDHAMEFYKKAKDRIRWVPEWKEWLVWNGQVWAKDVGGMKVTVMAGALLGSTAAQQNMLVQFRPMVEVHPADLDAHPYILNTPNGMIDLEWSPSADDYDEQGNPNFDEWAYLRPHDPEMLCTKMTGVKWAPQPSHVYDHETREYVDAPMSRWQRFLNEVQPKEEIQDYLQRWAGYFLLGKIKEHEMLVLEGEGANGKSVFTSVLLGVMGDYAAAGSHSLLIQQNHEEHPAALAATKGLRMCMVSETPRNAKLNESRLSQLTAGDSIDARFMRENPWNFIPTAKLVMTTNHRPDVTSSEAIWRRIREVPWMEVIPMEKRDFNLARDLIEREGKVVLDWMFQGWFLYQHRGLKMPDSLVTTNEEYRAEQDVIGNFIDEMNYTMGDTSTFKTSVADFNYHLDEWCKHSGMIRPTRNERTKIMAKKGFVKRKTAQGWQWFGLSHDNILAKYQKGSQS